MKNQDLQFISDSILMEKLSRLDLVKQAGLFDSLSFGSLDNLIKNYIKENFNPDAPGGITASVLNMLAQGAIFTLNPGIWLLVTAISYFLGIDIKSIIVTIVERVKSLFAGKEQVTMEEVNQVGTEVASGLSGSTASQDLFEVLRKMSDQELSHINKMSHLLVLKNADAKDSLRKFFGSAMTSVPKSKLSMLVVAILTWIVKRTLLGAGLIAGTAIVGSLFGKDKEPSTEPSKPGSTEPGSSEPISPQNKPQVLPGKPEPKSILTPSGKGEKYFENVTENRWIAPLSGSIEDTILDWTLEIYPGLKPMEYEITGSYDFQDTVNNIEKNYNSSMPREIIMPLEYHSWKQVVDTFVNDIRIP